MSSTNESVFTKSEPKSEQLHPMDLTHGQKIKVENQGSNINGLFTHTSSTNDGNKKDHPYLSATGNQTSDVTKTGMHQTEPPSNQQLKSMPQPVPDMAGQQHESNTTEVNDGSESRDVPPCNMPLIGVAAVGNPGTGKSTILNGLTGVPVFESGLAYGSGLTVHMKEHIVHNTSYYDTPGLDDSDIREQAGAEIDKVLARKQDIKLIFVVTELNGRIKPEDSTTISLVLDAIEAEGGDAQSLNNCFAVVINQASREFIKRMQSERETEEMVRSKLTGHRHTEHWVYIENNPAFVSKTNGVLHNDELLQLLQKVPVTKRKDARIQPVNIVTFDERVDQAVKVFKEKEKILENELQSKKTHVEEQSQKAQEVMLMLKAKQKEKQNIERKTAAIQARLDDEMRKQAQVDQLQMEIELNNHNLEQTHTEMPHADTQPISNSQGQQNTFSSKFKQGKEPTKKKGGIFHQIKTCLVKNTRQQGTDAHFSQAHVNNNGGNHGVQLNPHATRR